MKRSWRTLNGLDILTLRLLVVAGEEGNLARVSERENIAISAVSRRISDFEQRNGVQIFDRHDRGVSVTADGAILIEKIRAVLEQLEQVAEDIADRCEGLAGLVRVRAHMSASISGSLPARIADFLAQHPGIDVELDECTSIEVLHSVSIGTSEVGFFSGNVDSKGLELLPWEEDELVAIVHKDNPLAKGDGPIAFVDLLDYPFIGMQRDSALLSLYRTHATAMNRTLIERVHGMSFEGVRAYVRAQLGVSILPAVAADPFAEREDLVVRRLTDSWAHRPLMICVRKGGRLSAAARRLVEHLTGTTLPARQN